MTLKKRSATVASSAALTDNTNTDASKQSTRESSNNHKKRQRHKTDANESKDSHKSSAAKQQKTQANSSPSCNQTTATQASVSRRSTSNATTSHSASSKSYKTNSHAKDSPHSEQKAQTSPATKDSSKHKRSSAILDTNATTTSTSRSHKKHKSQSASATNKSKMEEHETLALPESPPEPEAPALPHADLHECTRCLHCFTSLQRLAHHENRKCYKDEPHLASTAVGNTNHRRTSITTAHSGGGKSAKSKSKSATNETSENSEGSGAHASSSRHAKRKPRVSFNQPVTTPAASSLTASASSVSSIDSRRSSASHQPQPHNASLLSVPPPSSGTSHRVSLTPSCHSALSASGGEDFVCLANGALSFKLVHSTMDTQTDLNTFHPSFTHQLFADEEIRGYKRCEVQMMFSASTLYSYLHMRFDECLPHAERDDVAEIICTKLPSDSVTTHLHKFTHHIAHEARHFKPPGDLIHSYEVPSVTSGNKDLISYEVYLGRFTDAQVKAYHKRLQFFLLFFIDRSSYINDDDTVWEVVFLFQKKRSLLTNVSRRESSSTPSLSALASASSNASSASNSLIGASEESVTYSICGYTTLYKFLAYQPAGVGGGGGAAASSAPSWRLRLSQILLLPPFQRCGHGQQLLHLVYRLTRERQCVELNIEDPSPVFQLVRDLIDVKACREQGFYQLNKVPQLDAVASESEDQDSSVDDASASSWLQGWDRSLGERIRKQLRITLSQVRRCYEILKLAQINMKDERTYTQYRLEIKRRLFVENEHSLSVNTHSAAERKSELAELYSAIEQHYLTVIRKARLH